MKKLLQYIFIIFIFSFIGANAAHAATSPVDELIEEFKDKPKTALSQDMYLQIYKDINDKPKEQATKNVSSTYSMTEDQINKLIQEGDLSAIIKDDENADINKVLLQYQKIANDYRQTLETENIRSELIMETKPSEVFMDGDTSNSEFDILYDLTIIEVILFNEASTGEFGGKFTAPDFNFTDEDEKQFIEELFDITPTDQSAQQEAIQDGDGFSALQCLSEESGLDEALSEYESQKETTSEGDSSSEGYQEDEPVNSENFPKAESDPWPSKYLCPDGAFYCIDISFDLKAAKAYGKTDNCIDCHVQKTNESLDKLLSKPLSANKLTGNLLEVPKCKASYSNIPVNMNIIMLAVTPPRKANQDKYLQLNIDKEWTTLKERLNVFFYNTDNPPPETKLEDRSVKESFQAAPDNPSLNEVSIRTSDRTQRTQEKVVEETATKEKENRTELNNTEYQMVINEMETMKQSFQTILTKLKEMKKPCTNISNKSYCQ